MTLQAERFAYYNFIVQTFRPNVLVPNLRQGLPVNGDTVPSFGANQSRTYSLGATLTAQRLVRGGPPGVGLIGPLSDRSGAAAAVVRTPMTLGANSTIAGWAYIPDNSRQGSFVQINEVGESGAPANGLGVGVGSSTFDAAGNNGIGLRETIAFDNSATAWGTGWVHFAYTYSGTNTVTMYKNGASIYTTTGGRTTTNVNYVCVGGYNQTSGSHNRRANCVVVWAGIWMERALSTNEINNLYLSGLNPAMHRTI